MEYQYPLKFGKYLLTRRVAVGGMAEVFKAKLIGPKGFEKTLAVKKILPEFSEDEEFVQMFVDEARISSNLHHGNIVQVFDFGEVNRSFYITMEFIDGPNLKNLLQRSLKSGKKLSRNLALYIGVQVAKALDYAHNVHIEGQSVLNLVHRDVSPQNVLISRSGEIKITDFGIAKASIKLSKTQPGKIQGKLSYMSPEQAAGYPIDRRSDIFSLGVILYELLTGVKVYANEDTSQRYSDVREARIARLGAVARDVPAQVEGLIMRMLSKDPRERPQTCADVIQELSEVLNAESFEKLVGDLGQLVQELFPRESSDADINRKVTQLIQGGQMDNEPGTAVDLDRITPSYRTPVNRSSNTPMHVRETTFRTSITRTPWVLFGILLLAIAWTGWMQWHSTFKAPSPPPTVTPIIPQPSGPLDQDMREAARRRQAEVAAKMRELEEQVEAAEEKAAITEKQLKEAKQALKERDTEVVIPAVPKGACPKDMVHIRPGTFAFGSDRGDQGRNDLVESESQKIFVQGFCIDPYEYPNRKGSLPLSGINWNRAQELCAQSGKRLCAQDQWERACKGSQPRRYPYGDFFDPQICNTEAPENSGTPERKLAASGSLDRCVSPDGVFDMSGNVDEWTGSIGRYNPQARVIKGGSVQRPGYQARCASVREVTVGASDADIGFRCCKDVN